MTTEKHAHVILSGKTLVNLMLESMSDEEVADFLGCGTEQRDEMTFVVTPGGYWEVSWPEHVTFPRYNSDANYLGKVADSAAELTEEQMELLHSDSYRQVCKERISR